MDLLVDGHPVHAYTGGKPFDRALPCVVFIHGSLHDHSLWTLLARWFAHHGHAVLAVDLPGHGRSGGPPPADIEQAAGWLLRLLDAAGVAQAALVGHSMGALIALQAAAQAPERATRLVMVGIAYPMRVSQVLLDTARETPLKAIDMVNAFSISNLASKPSYPGPGSWLHGANRALMRRALATAERRLGINLFAHDFAMCDGYSGGLQAAAQVRCPVNFILGERDAMTPPKSARDIAAALRASVTTLPCGHWSMGEQPDGVLKALRTAFGR